MMQNAVLSIEESKQKIRDALALYTHIPRSTGVALKSSNERLPYIQGNAGDLADFLTKLDGELTAGGQRALMQRLQQLERIPNTSELVQNTKLKQRLAIENILYGNITTLEFLSSVECANPSCCHDINNTKLKACGGCGCVKYCGRACQKVHWKAGHREVCQNLAAATEDVVKNPPQPDIKDITEEEIQQFAREHNFTWDELRALSPSLNT